MEFNKITRGANRAVNETQTVYEILDAGFLCHIAFQHQQETMMIPTAYGRRDDTIYVHGSTKNFMLNQITNGQNSCISVTHLDGVVLARTLFDTSANYRSVVLFGKAQIVNDPDEKMDGLKIITNHIIDGRLDEVPLGTDNQLKATLVVKFSIEKASAKIRSGGPEGDEDKTNEIWSGHIPLALKALNPVADEKFNTDITPSRSVLNFLKKYS